MLTAFVLLPGRHDANVGVLWLGQGSTVSGALTALRGSPPPPDPQRGVEYAPGAKRDES